MIIGPGVISGVSYFNANGLVSQKDNALHCTRCRLLHTCLAIPTQQIPGLHLQRHHLLRDHLCAGDTFESLVALARKKVCQEDHLLTSGLFDALTRCLFAEFVLSEIVAL